MKKISVTKIGHFTGHRDSIYALCNGTEPNTFFTGGADGLVVRWDTNNGNTGYSVAVTQSPVYSLCAWSSSLLLAGTSAGNIHLVSLEEKKEIRAVVAHEKGVFSLLQINTNILASCGGDGTVKYWSLPGLELLQTRKYSDSNARCMSVNATMEHLAVGYSDLSIRIFSLQDLTLLYDFPAHNNSVFAIAYRENILFSGGRDALIKTWDAGQDYRETASINAHLLHVNHLAFSPDQQLLASASMDKTIKIWDAVSCQLLKVIDKERNDAHINSVNKLIWLGNNRIVACSDDRTTQLFELFILERENNN